MSSVDSSHRMSPVTTIIEPPRRWAPIDWLELFRYRNVLLFLVIRDIKILYKQAALGYLWAIIRPTLSMILFTVVFGRLARVPSDGVPYPLFAFVALLAWSYFSSALQDASNSLVANKHILTKVYFPRLMLPLSPIFAKLVDFVLAFAMFGVLMIWYQVELTTKVLLLPLAVALMILTATGAGLWLSALSLQYRDIRHATPFLTQLLLYAAPVVWPVSLVPDEYRLLAGLYPMVGVIEGFRSALLDTGPMPWDLLAIGLATAVAGTLSGALFFKHKESSFADVA